MSFGFRCVGSAGQVQIDDAQSVLRMMARGTWARSGSAISVTYPAPIQSQAAPVVFVRPDGAGMFSNFNHTGSPGNWTGFTAGVSTSMAGMSGGGTTGKYAACALDHPGSGQRFGMLVNNAAGVRVFDTGHRAPRFVGGGQTWNELSSVSGGAAGGVLFRYRLPWNLPSSAYVMISGFKHRWDNVNLSDVASIGFFDNQFQWVWAVLHSYDSYPPYRFNWPMLAADFGA